MTQFYPHKVLTFTIFQSCLLHGVNAKFYKFRTENNLSNFTGKLIINKNRGMTTNRKKLFVNVTYKSVIRAIMQK